MDQALLNLINGIPIAAAVLYVWIVSEKNHTEEIAQWRESLEKKDEILKETQNTIGKLVIEIKKSTFIIENYVIRNGKNPAGKQNQQPEEDA